MRHKRHTSHCIFPQKHDCLKACQSISRIQYDKSSRRIWGHRYGLMLKKIEESMQKKRNKTKNKKEK